jgi:hypothetical protein
MLLLPRRSCAQRPSRKTPLSPLEALEIRMVPAVATVAGPPVLPDVRPTIEVQAAPSASATAIGARPQAWSQTTPWGFGPQQIAAAYGFNAVAFGGIAGDGAGQTIAIVDAYDDPALVDSSDPGFASSDLAQFDRQYGLPDPPSFVKLNESGGTGGLPGVDPAGAGMPGNWEEEEALDVEWAHAMAPGASIVLVECQSSGGPDLYAGAQLAATMPGVSVVSMSWGSAEYSGEGAYDGDFTTPAGHAGVTFVAATGDAGAPGLYPAYSPNVLAVGGTNLTIQGDGSYGSEAGWSNGGGGTSITEAQPSYQDGVQATGRRTIPDVALDADPLSGVSVYDSYDDTDGSGPWMKTGGTSLAAPVWAALIAIADQGRVSAGGTTLDGASQVLPALYALPASDFHDVTTGGNGVFEAGPGYDQSTGLGTPMAGMVVPALAYDNLAPWLATASGPPSVVAAGQPFGMTIEVENSDGSLDANFVGSVTIRLGDDPGGDALGGTLTEPAIGGYATFTGLTLTHAAAGYTILAASVDGPASSTTAPFAVAAGAPAQLTVVRTAAAGHGAVALTVGVIDVYGNLVTAYDGGVTLRWGNHGRGHSPRARQAGIVAMASGGIATFARLKPATGSRRHVLQAETDGLAAAAVLTLPDPAAAGTSPGKALNRTKN